MKYCSLTDIGLVRERNEDNFSTIENKNSDILFFVCDGIGGNNAGDIASKEVTNLINDIFKNASKFKTTREIIKFINYFINEANEHLLKLSKENPKYLGLGTTITGILVSGKHAFSFNVGDSRVYGIKNKKIKLLTKDDSLVNLLVDEGKITKEEAKTHPKRSHLIKAIGINQLLDVPVNKLDFYDYFLICSDGLYSMIDENDILKILTNQKASIETKTKQLVHQALLNGGYDNITLIVIDSNGGKQK